MLGLALLSALILSCIAGPVIQNESTAQERTSKLLVTDYAIDISTLLPLTVFQCFHQNTYKIVFIRAYHPYGQGQVDQSAIDNIRNADSGRDWHKQEIRNLNFLRHNDQSEKTPELSADSFHSAGLGIEAYMVPEPKSNKTGTVQFNEMYDHLKNSFIYLNSVWIQVSAPSTWLPAPSDNIAFLNDILLRASMDGLKVGIYTNNDDWSRITGGARINNAMLWYWSVKGVGASNMTPANFNDFSAFGGWTAPSVKQFVQADTLCGVTLNRNVYDTQIPVGVEVANKEKSGRITVGGLGLAESTFGGRPLITCE
ncbi:hypothetical protein OSTOST_03833, partial [Ostertagia ostertagi]